MWAGLCFASPAIELLPSPVVSPSVSDIYTSRGRCATSIYEYHFVKQVLGIVRVESIGDSVGSEVSNEGRLQEQKEE